MLKYMISFNTGRGYSAGGQVVTVEQAVGQNGEQLKVLFHDHTRGIWGMIDAHYNDDESLESFVMRHYDMGNYSPNHMAGSLDIQEH